MNRLIAAAVGVPLWAWITAVFGASLCAITAIYLGEEHQDGDRPEFTETSAAAQWRQFEAEERIRAEMRQAADDIDRALAILCDPCNGRPGRCRCTAKACCPNPLCGADDTIVADVIGELELMLRREGGSR